MKITKELLDMLTEQAKVNPRLRQSYDMRTTPEDDSQRMMNAIEPESVIPIHRHTMSTETVVVLRGAVRQYYYDEEGKEIDSFVAAPGTDLVGFSVPIGQWHRSVALESGTIIFESKDKRYGEDGSEMMNG